MASTSYARSSSQRSMYMYSMQDVPIVDDAQIARLEPDARLPYSVFEAAAIENHVSLSGGPNPLPSTGLDESTCRKDSEKLFYSYLKSIFEEYRVALGDDQCVVKEVFGKCDKEIMAFKSLASFLASNLIRPDLWLYKSLKITGKPDETVDFPLLLAEIVSSGNFEATCRKAALDALNLLRFLRHHHAEINKVNALVFPSKDCSGAAVVTISWKELAFSISYKEYENLAEFDHATKEAIALHMRNYGLVNESCVRYDMVQQEHTFSPPPLDYLVPLSSDDLEMIRQKTKSNVEENLLSKKITDVKVHVATPTPVPSKFSVLVKVDVQVASQPQQTFYLKSLVDNSEEDALAHVEHDLQDPFLPFVPPSFTFQFNTGQQFFAFKEATYGPFSRFDIVSGNFSSTVVVLVLQALEQLHSDPINRAHLDVRLPNIVLEIIPANMKDSLSSPLHGAFQRLSCNYYIYVRFIDMDRCTPVSADSPSYQYTGPLMKSYFPGVDSLTAGQQDFVQVVFILAMLYLRRTGDAYTVNPHGFMEDVAKALKDMLGDLSVPMAGEEKEKMLSVFYSFAHNPFIRQLLRGKNLVGLYENDARLLQLAQDIAHSLEDCNLSGHAEVFSASWEQQLLRLKTHLDDLKSSRLHPLTHVLTLVEEEGAEDDAHDNASLPSPHLSSRSQQSHEFILQASEDETEVGTPTTASQVDLDETFADPEQDQAADFAQPSPTEYYDAKDEDV